MASGNICIIIPTYNAEKTIGRCLESIFAQTFREFEVIVVDDGSTDGTKKIIEDFFSKCRMQNAECRIRLIVQENRGAQAARNRGWEECRMQNEELRMKNVPSPGLRPPSPQGGEGKNGDPSPAGRGTIGDSSPSGRGEGEGQYILFCDADIVLRPDCLEKMVQALEKNPDASYAYSSFKFGWKKFKLWPFDATRLKQMPYIHTTSLIRYSAIEEMMSSVKRYTFPRSRISVTSGDHDISKGPFDESVKRLQDWDLWLTMLEHGHTGVWVPEALFQVVNTKGTMSQWLPSFVYKIPKWLGIQTRAVARYNEAVAAIKEKHHLL